MKSSTAEQRDGSSEISTIHIADWYASNTAWLLYLGYTHAREAIVPLLGQAPSKDMIRRIRETAKSVEGVKDAHEIIVHDYGSMYLIPLHAEIPAGLGPDEMHEIAERSEDKLREASGGEAVVHTDPMMERTPDIDVREDVAEDQFSQISEGLEARVLEGIRNVAYRSFYVTPEFAY